MSWQPGSSSSVTWPCWLARERARFSALLLCPCLDLLKPEVQEKALSGNTIFFAQPTADVPCMELPPPPDALVDSFCIRFPLNLQDLSVAEWANVTREE